MGKKITFCTYDAPLFHGPNTWLKRLLSDLKSCEFTIEVLVFFEDDLVRCDTYQYFLKSGFKTKAFPFQSIAEKKIQWILQTLASDPPDIFVPHMLVHAFFAASWLKKAGIPTIGLIHSDDNFYNGIIDEFVVGQKEYSLTAVVACSKYLFEKVHALKTSDTISRYIPYGVPNTNMPSTTFNGDKLKLIYIGRLVEKQKKIREVVKAICQASNQIAGVEGAIYGHGEVEKVVALIKKYSSHNNVEFGGSVSNEEIFNALSKAHVFVLLSDYEGLPQALLEAMACGLVPVCTYTKSGIPELIKPNVTGIIVSDRKSEFIKAIQRLKNDAALCEKISENVKKTIKNYSTELCTNSWINLLNELLATSKPRGSIEIPNEIQLPKRHPYLKHEDFRIPTKADLVMNFIRKSKAFRLIKKFASRP